MNNTNLAIEILSRTRNLVFNIKDKEILTGNFKIEPKHEEDLKRFLIKSNYFSKIYFVRWLFWKRLEVVIKFLKDGGDSVLDFGTQMGLILPSLSKIFKNVYGVDIDDTTFAINRELIKRLNIGNVKVFTNKKPLNQYFKKDSLNPIVALDVLEHIPKRYLFSYLKDFLSLLDKNGCLVVSLPKENSIYRFMQKLINHKPEEAMHFLNYKELESSIKKYFYCEASKNLIFFKIIKFRPKERTRIMFKIREKSKNFH